MDHRLTLKQLFLRIVLVGAGTCLVVGVIFLQQARRTSLQQWQQDTVARSAAILSAYYSSLITKLIVDQADAVKDILQYAQTHEALRSIRIIASSQLSTEALKTCKVHEDASLLFRAPTCFEKTPQTLYVYHELRSSGHSFGYLMKAFPVPHLPLLYNGTILPYMVTVLLCFFGIHAIILRYFCRHIMRPTQQMIASLNEHQPITVPFNAHYCRELYMLVSSLATALQKNADYQEKAKQLEYDAKIGQITAQVAHDIRSPLAALDVAMTSLAELPEEKRILVRHATERIRDIANGLLIQSQETEQPNMSPASATESVSVTLLSSLLDTLITEKRLQFRRQREVDIQLELRETGYGLFACVQPVEFQRIVSNLVNNAVESLQGCGHVQVSQSPLNDTIHITVRDTGKGIPSEMLPQLMARGATFGKARGHGLGLSHARNRIEKWGGAIHLQSTVGKGTIVTVTLPQAPPPAWFVPSLSLTDQLTIGILDDDPSIHAVWQERFAQYREKVCNLILLHFSNAQDMIAWHQQTKEHAEKRLYLIDYELLDQPSDGVALIERLHIAAESILVTSRYDEERIQQACAAHDIRLLPKGFAGFVPIHIERAQQTIESRSRNTQQDASYDCILIDDDSMVHMAWIMAGKSTGKKIGAFDNADAFLAIARHIHKGTPIYVDAQLGNDVNGSDVTRTLHEMGFKNIYLATGYNSSHFCDVTWVKGIRGKDPPWMTP